MAMEKTAKPIEEKHQCQRCGAILEPKKDAGQTLCGFPVIWAPLCPNCGWYPKPKDQARPELWIELGPEYEDPMDDRILRIETELAARLSALRLEREPEVLK